MQLRPHQKEALSAVINEFKKADRCHIVMACGTGKTFTSLAIMQKLKPTSVVIFVPSLALINQFLKSWDKQINIPNEMIAICSDNNVISNEDEALLEEPVAIPVTNHSDEILKFYKRKNNKCKIFFCTYQSSYILGDALQNYIIDLGIFDEAHKTAGYNKKTFSHALHNHNVKIAKRLFMTATPRHGTPRMNAKGEPVELYSMDNEAIYGKRAYNLSFRDAIKLGLICDYRIIISAISNKSKNHEFNKDYELQEKAESLKKAIAESGAKKIITFHSSVNHAIYFASQLQKTKVHENILHINARLGMEGRHSTMQKFRSAEKSIITNAKCLTEGVDVPNVDMVAFLNPKSSKIDIVQAIGRALRVAPGKKMGYIFLPLLINDFDNIESEVLQSEFRPVWDVLNAMMEQDSELSDTVKFLGRTGGTGGQFNDKYDQLAKHFNISNKTLSDLIEVKVLNRLVSPWDVNFAKLCEYKQKYNSVEILPDHPDENLKKWINVQRNNEKTIPDRRREQLNAIGFKWRERRGLIPSWQTSYHKLVEYKKQFGKIPTTKDAHPVLFNWIEWQRRKHKAGKLPDAEYQLLRNLGVIFYRLAPKDAPNTKTAKNVQEAFNNKWKEKLKLLKAYKELYGHTNVPQRGEHMSLGKWCCAQREDKRLNKMTEWREDLLKSLDFNFNPIDSLWYERFDELKSFYEGNIKSLSTKTRYWITYQRLCFKEKRLFDEKINLLKSIKFDFNIPEKFTFQNTPIDKHPRWENILDYYKNNKTWSISKQDHISNIVKHLREHYRKNTLCKESILIMDKLNFVWNPVGGGRRANNLVALNFGKPTNIKKQAAKK